MFANAVGDYRVFVNVVCVCRVLWVFVNTVGVSRVLGCLWMFVECCEFL